VEMKTSFMRPAEGRLACKAQLLHRSTTLAFCEASVFDEDRHLCAHATGTFKYLRKLPTKGRVAKPLQHKDA
jgi:acyl-coenzyme A thioesterase PaaI-like protein